MVNRILERDLRAVRKEENPAPSMAAIQDAQVRPMAKVQVQVVAMLISIQRRRPLLALSPVLRHREMPQTKTDRITQNRR